MTVERAEGFPRNFGPYLLLSSLGRGGMGEVFLAKKRALSDVDRLVIVKTLRGDLSEHGEFVRRFLDEARIVVQLTHSNICQVLESGKLGADFYLTMEYIPGVNLKELALDLQQQGMRVSPGVALHVGEQVCEALGYAHRLRSPMTGEHLRVVHRDVSPANVMVSFEGEVKLIDFGLAESTLKTEQTETRLVMGKVAYMSPEQARGEDLDGSVDQFAAAICIYEMLAGDRFYGDFNTHQVWQVVGHGGFVPRKWNELDGAVQAVLSKALSPSPKDRYPSCDAFRDALEELRARIEPRAGRASLREILNRLYADRIEGEREIIASFADLRAPDPSSPSVEKDATMKSSSAPRFDAGTEPWRNSPSDANQRPAGAQNQSVVTLRSPTLAQAVGQASSAPPPELSSTQEVAGAVSADAATKKRASVPDGLPLASSPPPGDSGLSQLRPPPNNGPKIAAAIAVLAVVVVVAIVLWPGGATEARADAGAEAALTVVDAGAGAGLLASAHAGADADAGGADADAGSAGAVAAVARPHGGHKRVDGERQPVEAPVEKASEKPVEKPIERLVETPVEKPAVRGPADLGLREIESVLAKCAQKEACASAVLDLIGKPGGTATSKVAVSQPCLAKCWKDGLRP